MPTLLLTRPQSDSEKLSQELYQDGFECLIAPMLEILPLDFVMPDFEDYDGAFITSGNAVQILCDHKDFKNSAFDASVYCTGAQTHDALKDKGFTNVQMIEGVAKDLVKYLSDKAGQKFIHLRGVHAAFPLEKVLKKKNVQVISLPIYTAQKAQEIDAEIIQAIKSRTVNGVVLYSKRTAESFLAIAKKQDFIKDLQPVDIFCISKSVQLYVHSFFKGQGKDNFYIADKADGGGMRTLIKSAY